MRIVIEREAEKYKRFVYDYYWRVLRSMYKYRDLTPEQSKVVGELVESWFSLKAEWNIKEDEE